MRPTGLQKTLKDRLTKVLLSHLEAYWHTEARIIQDLFQMDPVEIPTVRVEMTLVGGEIVFRSEG